MPKSPHEESPTARSLPPALQASRKIASPSADSKPGGSVKGTGRMANLQSVAEVPAMRSAPQQQSDPREATLAGTSWLPVAPVGAVLDVPEDVAEPVASDNPTPVERETVSSARHNEFERLFVQWRETGDERLRERLILMNRNLVSYLARKFMDRGEMSDDIIQQGLIGLINALDHFDPARGVRFATFATPTIMGEMRRYFRDKTWGIRVPRRLQELNAIINAKIDELTQKLDRSPTYAEIARSLNLQIEDVVEALEMVHALDPLSIDDAVFGGEETASISDHLGAPDPQIEGWNEHSALEAALEELPSDERKILQMAYFEERSQVEIAAHMQVSQMYVSRLQRKALARLRDLMNTIDF